MKDEDTLREAASRVRDIAVKATKNVCPDFTWSAVRHIARNCDVHEDCMRSGELLPADSCNTWDRYEDSPWIALMDAKLAEPLAAWLEVAAEYDATARKHAIAVARTLLDAELPR